MGLLSLLTVLSAKQSKYSTIVPIFTCYSFFVLLNLSETISPSISETLFLCCSSFLTLLLTKFSGELFEFGGSH